MFNEKNAYIIKSKRIVGYTMTATATYVKELQTAFPDVLFMNEVSEILKSYIIIALDYQTKQLILIEDHKQLRLKVNKLSFQRRKNKGYDLNRFLFKQLVLKSFSHLILTKQYQMRLKILSLICQLTYFDLVDTFKTLSQSNLRDFQNNILFINHIYSENNMS